MSRVLVTARTIARGTCVRSWLLARGRELSTASGAPMAALGRLIAVASDNVARVHTALSVAARGYDPTHLDAVAGSEFVDDEIRHAE
jgi:hypothetical protein